MPIAMPKVSSVPALANAGDELRQGARRAAVRALLDKAIDKIGETFPDPRVSSVLETRAGRSALAGVLSIALDAAPVPDKHRALASEVSAELRISSYDETFGMLLALVVSLLEEVGEEIQTAVSYAEKSAAVETVAE